MAALQQDMLSVGIMRPELSTQCCRWQRTPPPCTEEPTVARTGHCLVQVKNSVGDDSREGVYVTSQEEEDLVGSKGMCNFQIKWSRDARSSAYVLVQESVKKVTRAGTGELPPLLQLSLCMTF